MTRDFDYVVVGGGTAGCVVAGELARRGIGSIAVLEQGSPPVGRRVRTPCLYPTLFVSRWAEAWRTSPQPHLRGRRIAWPRGKMFGGSTGLNAMIYLRATPEDFQAWPATWSYEEVDPIYQAIEHRIFQDAEASGQSSLEVPLEHIQPVSERFLEAARLSGFSSLPARTVQPQPGCLRYRRTQRRGRRCTTYEYFLKPYLDGTSLRRFDNTFVEEILFRDDRAVGVRLRHENSVSEIHANKALILCGGTIQTPAILMRSGIGRRDRLKVAGIVCRIELPVGENLQDHLVFPVVHATSSDHSLPRIFSREQRIEYAKSREGLMTSNIAEVGGFFQSSDAGLDFQLHFTPTHYLEYAAREEPTSAWSIGVTPLHPKSRGMICFDEKQPGDLIIDPSYLSAASDRSDIESAIQIAESIAAQSPLDEISLGRILPKNGKDLRSAIAAYSTSIFHPVGTCKMGEDEDSVVSSRMQVRGVNHLYIADASVIPELTSGNPQATVMMLGYRLADILSNSSES
jgi:choline dehydrogenase